MDFAHVRGSEGIGDLEGALFHFQVGGSPGDFQTVIPDVTGFHAHPRIQVAGDHQETGSRAVRKLDLLDRPLNGLVAGAFHRRLGVIVGIIVVRPHQFVRVQMVGGDRGVQFHRPAHQQGTAQVAEGALGG